MGKIDVLSFFYISVAKKIHSKLRGVIGFLPYLVFLYAITHILGIAVLLIASLVYDRIDNFALKMSPLFVVGYLFISGIRSAVKGREIFFKESIQAKNTTFGKARFAEDYEVKETGLFGDGIVFGRYNKHLVTKPPKVEGHTLIIGGTGSGKTSGVVIPSLFKWKGSALVMDIKGEISKITKEKRSSFGEIYIFDAEGKGDCYDPIALCGTIDQAQDFARTLIPVPEKGDPFWNESAQAILSAFVFEGAKYGYKLGEIAEKLCTTPIGELVDYCKNHELREVKLLASITYDTPEKTLGGIMSSLKSRLITIATDENIRYATSRSDWNPESLESGATVYLKVAEHLLDQYKDIWTIIFSQCLKHLSKRDDSKDPPILIVIDEMPRLAKINGLVNALATLRSRNVHIMGIIQSMAQLDSIYGKDERKIIADNCRFKFVLSATDPDTQKYFSELAGQRTALAKGTTIGAGMIPNMSRNEQGTPLIRPEEWANLEKPILFAPRLQPIPIDLTFWFKEKF
jgi:type IV secretion system protein VirD4